MREADPSCSTRFTPRSWTGFSELGGISPVYGRRQKPAASRPYKRRARKKEDIPAIDIQVPAIEKRSPSVIPGQANDPVLAIVEAPLARGARASNLLEKGLAIREEAQGADDGPSSEDGRGLDGKGRAAGETRGAGGVGGGGQYEDPGGGGPGRGMRKRGEEVWEGKHGGEGFRKRENWYQRKFTRSEGKGGSGSKGRAVADISLASSLLK